MVMSRRMIRVLLLGACIVLVAFGGVSGYFWAYVRESAVSSNQREKQIAVYSDSSTHLGTVTIVLIDNGFGISVRHPGVAPSNQFYFDANGLDGFMIRGRPFDHPRGRIEVTVRDIDGDGIVDDLDMDPEWTDAFKSRDISEDIMEVVRERISNY